MRAWRHNYGPFLDEQRLAERSIGQREQRWRGILSSDGAIETSVLEVGGRIVGYVSLGPSADSDATAATGQLFALYVDPPAQGAGAGTMLLSFAQRRLDELGFTHATLWTFEQNGLARAFYERHGWRRDDTTAVDESCEQWAPAVRYRREAPAR